MRLEEQMKSGLLYREYGHKDPVDQEYEKIIEKQRVNAKEMMFDFNNTRPSDMETRTKILKELLGSVGKGIYLEPPALRIRRRFTALSQSNGCVRYRRYA